MDALIAKLQGTDRRSIGRSEEVVSEVLADPGQFRLVFDAMLMPDPVVRMRAADAVEELTRRRPDLLRGWRAACSPRWRRSTSRRSAGTSPSCCRGLP